MARIVLLDDLPIGIDARGRWFHGDAPLHPRVQDLFARSVHPTAAGGYEVVLGAARSPIVVADTAYFVRAAWHRRDAAGRLVGVDLVISDGQHEPLDPTTLMQAVDGTFYSRIVRANSAVPARWAPGDYHALALCCVETDDGIALCLGGHCYDVNAYDARPRPR